jgi:hypothetical protein
MGQHATGVNGERLGSQTMAGTDDVGCLSFRTYVGDLTLYIYLEQTRAASLFLVAAASVRAPGPQELVLDLQLGRLDLEVRTPDGAPAAELDLELSPAGGSRPLRVRTASDGTLRAAAFVGSYVIRVRPKHLGTQAARDEFARAHGYRALEEAWIPAGSIDVAPGAARPQRLTLPDAWAR